MKTLLLMSVILVTLGAPLVAARDPDAIRAGRRLLVFFAIFCAVYSLYVGFVHPTFVPQR